jgi:holo-[acyl-carrier protein] synthase
MRIISQGLDLVDCRRVEDLIIDHGESFLARVFTPWEINYCRPRARRIEHFAGRFAAKEAVMKVLGTGWRGGVSFTDIEVRNSGTGEPEVILSGMAAQAARRRGITKVMLSITHLRDLAAASAIGVGED